MSEVVFVLFAGAVQVAFHLCFAISDQCHEGMVIGFALLVCGPDGVAEVREAVQGVPWTDRWEGASVSAVSGGDRPARAAEVPVGTVAG